MKRCKAGWRTAALAAVVLVGCGKSPTTPAGGGGIPLGTNNDLIAMIGSAYATGAQFPTTLDTTANILAAINVEGLRSATAVFPILSGPLVQLSDAGAVSVRTGVGPASSEITLDKLQLNVAATIQTVYTTLKSHPIDVAIPFDGTTYHRFSLTGTTAVPARVDSVKSVTLPTISAPSAGATVSRSSNLTVSWSDAGIDTTVYMMVFVGSLVDTTQFAAATLTRDNAGSVALPSAALLLLPNGAASMSVVRFRLERRALPGRKLDLISETVRIRSLTLTD